MSILLLIGFGLVAFAIILVIMIMGKYENQNSALKTSKLVPRLLPGSVLFLCCRDQRFLNDVVTCLSNHYGGSLRLDEDEIDKIDRHLKNLSPIPLLVITPCFRSTEVHGSEALLYNLKRMAGRDRFPIRGPDGVIEVTNTPRIVVALLSEPSDKLKQIENSIVWYIQPPNPYDPDIVYTMDEP